MHEHSVRDVSDRQRDGFKLFVYNRWFAHDDWLLQKSFTYHLFEHKHIRAVAQFRMGVHWLNTESMNRAVPRSRRLCACCAASVREDERHVSECSCYADMRQRYTQFSICDDVADRVDGSDDATVYSLMNGSGDKVHWEQFALFLMKCKLRRKAFLDALGVPS